MTFIAERLPSTHALARCLPEIQAWPLRKEPVRALDWVVDTARRAFLVRTSSGHRDDPDFAEFGLWLDGTVFYAALTQQSEGEFRHHVTVRWRLRSLHAKDGVPYDRAAVLDTLREALAVYGVYGASVKVASLESEFDF